ncbi:hypothetical protein MKW98_024852 [Papaver atlanticum]|uniref:Uncharacterized protein n=1 Tax=Papaver atlanticum TaxID=357466 RepID=A0AAD4T4U8_9MAGN|nr:hypothetical protein MKW98_024852 [Papaver atlanticum]
MTFSKSWFRQRHKYKRQLCRLEVPGYSLHQSEYWISNLLTSSKKMPNTEKEKTWCNMLIGWIGIHLYFVSLTLQSHQVRGKVRTLLLPGN